MKKTLAIILSVMMLAGTTSFADTYVINNYDFDGTATGTWRNLEQFSTQEYPGTSNNCLLMPGTSPTQIYLQSGSASAAYYGRVVYSGDIYPMSSYLNTQIFLKFYKLNAPTSGAAVESNPIIHCMDFNGANIKVHNNANIIGQYVQETKYSYKVVADGVNQCYRVYLAGDWGGVSHPQPEEDSEECPGYMLIDTYDYPDGYGPVGMAYIYTGRSFVYADNLKLEAPDTEYKIPDFQPGDSEITFEMDQFINTDTMENLSLKKVSDTVTELISGSDYTISWKIGMENYPYAAVPTITFSEPIGENEQIIFDFSKVKDTYGRNIDINKALPENPDSDALNAAYKSFDEEWLTTDSCKNITVDAPSDMTPFDGGSTVEISYAVSGANNTTDEEAVELVKNENGKLVITQPEVDDATAEPKSFDANVKIEVSFSCGKQPKQTLVRELKIERKKLIDYSITGDADILTALSDDNEETAWSISGGSGELQMDFDEAYAIGNIYSYGKYDSIKYYASENGTDFSEITQYPVRAKSLKVNVTGEGASVTGLEPVISSFFDDVIARAEDLMTLEYSQNLKNLTQDTYLTLPKTTANGTPLQWSSNNSAVIDKFGTIIQTNKSETVILTAQALDAKGNVIDIAKKDYTATVSAKSTATRAPSGGGGGGGGGGGYSAPNIVPQATTVPTTEPTQGENNGKFNDISDVSWAEEAINYLAEKDIISGKDDKIFAPQDNITREEFIKIAVNAFDIDGTYDKSFDDVKKGAWYEEYVYTAAGADIINGISDTSFGVGKDISRQDIAVILNRIAKLKNYETDSAKDINSLSEAEDINDIADYAKEAFNAMVNAGVINGDDKKLNPNKPATRAETSVMIFRFIDKFGKQ